MLDLAESHRPALPYPSKRSCIPPSNSSSRRIPDWELSFRCSFPKQYVTQGQKHGFVDEYNVCLSFYQSLDALSHCQPTTTTINTMSFPSQTRPALAPIPLMTQSESTQTIKARPHFLPLEPPSYLSPAVRALKGSFHVLTPPSNARTKGPFKPRSATRGTSSYQLRRFAEETLGSGSLRKAVRLPEGEDVNEWLAVNGLSNYFSFWSAESNFYWWQ